MTEQNEFYGLWWLPEAPDRKVPGNLHFSRESGLTLKLSGELPYIGPELNERQIKLEQYPTILGCLSDTSKFTLFDCWETQRKGMLLAPQTVLEATRGFKGAHYLSEADIQFDLFRVQFDLLDSWVNRHGFEEPKEDGDRGLVIRYSFPDDIVLYDDDELTLKIVFLREGPGWSAVQTEMYVRQHTALQILPKEFVSFSRARQVLFIFRNFLSMALMLPVSPFAIQGQLRQRMRIVEILEPTPVLPALPDKVYSKDKMLFAYSDLESNLKQLFTNWLTKAERLQPVTDLYFGTRFNGEMFLEHKFLSMAQALECYHRLFLKKTYMEEDAYADSVFRPLVDCIPGHVSSPHKASLESRLRYGYEFSLRSRLWDILDIYYCMTGFRYPAASRFVEDVANTRNYLTHWTEKLRNQSLSGERLLKAYGALGTLLEVCFLGEMGMETTLASSLLERAGKLRGGQEEGHAKGPEHDERHPRDTGTAADVIPSNEGTKEDSEILRLRREKLDKLRALGVNPYPYRFEKDTHIPDLLGDFDSKIENEEHAGPVFSIAGRLHTIRIMGKAGFCHLRDEFGEMQIYVQRDRVGEQAYEIFRHLLDIGDIIGVRGTVFRTKTGEPTLRAQSFELLAKSLHPLPVVKEREGHVFDAFTDKEARYRQRYLDLAVNPSVRDIFRVRARIISAMREFLDSRSFLEVETPALQPLYGGALAKPFTTHYNVLDRDFFLRIADELYLKRLLVGGLERVYEISKDFRNEGMDKFHNPEFTMLEFYQAYADYRDLMDLSEELFRFVVRAALGTTEVTYQGQTVDFAKPFRRVTFFGLLKQATGTDLLGASAGDLAGVALKHGVAITREMGEGKILDEMMKTLVRPDLLEPTMIYDYPLSLSPLAKKHRDDPRLVERFQPFTFGLELGNAFSELNDPLDQRERFEAQRKLKEAGDEETQPLDEDFLRALETGMPPTAGMGIGVDRLTMLLTDQTSIREVILFPQLRT